MKVGLVLGAGGVLGGAWLTGGLYALARETGWDPMSADTVVGTSAGSMIGSLVAGWLPRGVISTEPLKDTIRRVVDEGWSDHPAHWVMACGYAKGHRVAFGRGDAPE